MVVPVVGNETSWFYYHAEEILNPNVLFSPAQPCSKAAMKD